MLGRLFSDPAPINVYQKHLPRHLYDYLTKLQLLDGDEHEFAIKGDKAKIKVYQEDIYQIDIDPKTFVICTESKEVITILLEVSEHQIRTAFTDKVWWASIIDGPKERIEEGNIKQFPLRGGKSDWECKLRTNAMVKEVSKLIDVIMRNKEVKLGRGSCVCTIV